MSFSISQFRLPKLAAVLAICASAGCIPISTSNIPDELVAVDGETFAQVSKATGQFGSRLNAYRAQNGRKALVRNAKLDKAAELHAKDMFENSYLSHTDRRGRTMRDRIKRQGYKACSTGENIAEKFPSEAAVFEAWLTSSAHRKVFLNTRVTEYGIASVGDKWVYLAAKPC
ncbi:CAP domain-containing protein [Nereida sp. MMG025]|uniref:CAP domain-containing protein n=1 Tax=Nereida sp. MMG025 TaxID=2909981 RepID=UPI001F253B61|nr:CAP domain-containing protein [Nereida sp. MMG025]MCF6443940.1 CAP domain-containing protein [Nereida sp. MMG025]